MKCRYEHIEGSIGLATASILGPAFMPTTAVQQYAPTKSFACLFSSLVWSFGMLVPKIC